MSKNFVTMMNIMDDNKHLIPEGDYLKFCNAIKGEFTTTDVDMLRQEILMHKETITSNKEELEELEEELECLRQGSAFNALTAREMRYVSDTRTKLLTKAYYDNRRTKTFSAVEHKFIGTMLSQDSRVEISGRGYERELNIVTQIERGYIPASIVTVSDINEMPLMMRRLL